MSFADEPVDLESADRLAVQGLELRLIDAADESAFLAWARADNRGFYEAHTTAELARWRETAGFRRTTGIYDGTIVEPEYPVATVASWPARLALPGGQAAAWAISSVTVAPTHRRRGIARAMIEAELRTAHRLGVPLAALTASEATIYGRYGFGPATWQQAVTIDTRRVRWTGPEASGSISFVGLEKLRGDALALLDQARTGRTGELAFDAARLDFALGTQDAVAEAPRSYGVRFDDADGAPGGFAVYTVDEPVAGAGYHEHHVTVRLLYGVDEGVEAALWHYLLDLDLVTAVTARERPVDDPVVWRIGDVRAATRTISDALWLRVLDVRAVLEARRYAAPGRFVLEISDPLAFTTGSWLLDIDLRGRGTVTQVEGVLPVEAARLSIGAAELGSICLGGTSVAQLASAGRLAEHTPGAAEKLDRALHATRAPWLSAEF